MKLSCYERAIFAVLEAKVGEIVPRRSLEIALSAVRPVAIVPQSNVLEVLLSRIRHKLPQGSTLRAIRGIGYQYRVAALCDVCQQHPGTRQILAAAGTDTLVCDTCSTSIAA